MGQFETVPCECVEVRCTDARVPEACQITVAQIVCKDENEIGKQGGRMVRPPSR